jgi:hypothetical protein
VIMFNIRTSNFAQAGKAAADDTVRSFAAARRNSPDFGKMAQQAASIRSKVKQEGINAASQVTRAGIGAAAGLEADSITRKGKRKAGALAAAGKMFGTAGSFMGEKRTKREVGESDEYFDKAIAAQKGKINALTDKITNLQNQPAPSSSTPKDSAPNTSSSNSENVGGKITSQKGGSTAMRLMTDLTNDGYTPVQAAAIVGNAQHESANFTAHEEYAPNAYGTKGAGFFQWTNAGGSNRRDNFENFAGQQGLDPRSYEANTGFMMHELKGGAGNHWTGGMNDQSFRQIGDLSSAVVAFQDNYLRPARAHAHTDRRMQNAQNILAQWQSQ